MKHLGRSFFDGNSQLRFADWTARVFAENSFLRWFRGVRCVRFDRQVLLVGSVAKQRMILAIPRAPGKEYPIRAVGCVAMATHSLSAAERFGIPVGDRIASLVLDTQSTSFGCLPLPVPRS
jgi:hypothetical protein